MAHIGLIIWYQFLFCKINVLLSVFIVSKIENIPPIRKFSKIKNKKTAITFGEECSWEIFFNSNEMLSESYILLNVCYVFSHLKNMYIYKYLILFS